MVEPFLLESQHFKIITFFQNNYNNYDYYTYYITCIYEKCNVKTSVK